MKKSLKKKVLLFPKPLPEPEALPIIVQIGMDRFAVHWKIEDLPPAAPRVPGKRVAKNRTVTIGSAS